MVGPALRTMTPRARVLAAVAAVTALAWSRSLGGAFLSLDDGRKREDAVKDIGALLDWIATQPHLDPERVVVSGVVKFSGFR